MAKKTTKSTKTVKSKHVNAKSIKAVVPAANNAQQPAAPKLPPELQKKLDVLKVKLDKFKDKIMNKFGDYIVGITVLPPQKNPIPDPSNPNQQENKNAKPNPSRITKPNTPSKS